jgi:hypothetical protein
VDWIIASFAFGILLAGWLMGRLLTAEEQRDPRWTLVFFIAVMGTAAVAVVVLTLLE